MLHGELKRSVVDDIARTVSTAPPTPTPVISVLTPSTSVPTLGQGSAQKWQTELVVTLHTLQSH